MDIWNSITGVLVVLSLAMILGVACERLKQNVLIGYLLAGVVLGPSGIALVENAGEVHQLAELGVALLLFTIGAEFSFRRLRELGSVAALGGTLQIVLTMAVAALISRWLGLPTPESVAIGAAVSVSSTAVVLRVLVDRSELDSTHGRNALGVLLLQDLAVVPLVVTITLLGEGGATPEALQRTGLTLLIGMVGITLIYVVGKRAHPYLLRLAGGRGNRELPVLLGVVTCLGATLASHAAGLSPILGAFVGGMLVAESPFAEQVRADIAALRAVFVTLFFASAGMLAEIPAGAKLLQLALLVAGIVVVKSLITGGVIRLFRVPTAAAAATGLVLAQIGEFSFVLLEVGRREGVVSGGAFQMLQSASVVTLLLTPYLISAASRLARSSRLASGGGLVVTGSSSPDRVAGRVVVVGYGPAGQQVVKRLQEKQVPLLVLDLNARTVGVHRASVPIEFGDATLGGILDHAGIAAARALIVTVPDPQTAQLIIRQARLVAPELLILARARYHIHADGLLQAGANGIVGEEDLVGDKLGEAFLKAVNDPAESMPDGVKSNI